MDSPITTLKSWDINPILDMLHSCSFSTTNSITKHNQSIATSTSNSSKITKSVTLETPALGDFDEIWKVLGKPIDIPGRKTTTTSFEDPTLSSPISSNTSPSSIDSLSTSLGYSTPYSYPGSDEEPVGLAAKEVQMLVDPPSRKQHKVSFKTRPHFEHDLNSPSATSHQALITRRAEKLRKEHGRHYAAEISSESEAEIELDVLRHDLPSHLPKKSNLVTPIFTAPSSLESQTGWLLTPGWVKPVAVPLAPSLPHPPPYIADVQVDPLVIQPRLTLTLAEKKELLAKKLSSIYGMDKDSMSRSRRALTLSQEGGNESDSGIHVFVDWSNIVIGFQEALKKARNMPAKAYIKRPPISYSSLALVMERGRPVARRVLAGSTTSDRILDEMLEAERCGYELNILERVRKARTPKKHHSSGSGYATSGLSSGPEMTSVPATMGEQAVDELLHMKMLESVVDRIQSPGDTKPTMIVATGDGAVAEYSGGFCKQVGRALQAGWNVELVTWRDQLAYAWREREFKKKWHKQFSIILLDDFAEELLAIYPRCEPCL